MRSPSVKEKFVIKVEYPGLGDHLFHSHLPQVAKTLGYKKVFVSNLSAFRSTEYRRLIWEPNPFVDGFCDDDVPSLATFQFIPAGMNLLDKVMLERNVDDGKRFHEPQLYYQPKIIPELSMASVYDPNYLSTVGNVSNKELERFLQRSGGVDFQMRVRGKAYPVQERVTQLDAADVFHYCDIIASCKTFFCLTSGGATLAAALGKPANVFYGCGQLPMFRHSRLHNYIEVSSVLRWTVSRAKYIFRRSRHLLDVLPTRPQS